MQPDDVIICPSLGRTCRLGDIYNFYNDKFTGMNVFSRPIAERAHTIIPNAMQVSDFVLSSKQSDKLNLLKINGEAKASILCGAIEVQGAVAYINEKKKDTKAVQCNFVHSIRTIDESVNINDETLKESFVSNLGQIGGTHIVIGINWGANVAVSLTYSNTNDRSKQEIEGKLKASLEKLKKFSINANIDGSGNFTDNDGLNETEFSLKVFADVPPSKRGGTRSLEDALELIHEMPTRVAELAEGKGKQLEFRLLPISALKKALNFEISLETPIHQLEASAIKSIEQLFNNIDESREAINDVMNSVNQYSKYLRPEEVQRANKYVNEFDIAVSDLQSSLGQKLIEVRSGKEEPIELQLAVRESQKFSKISTISVNEFIQSCAKIHEKIALVETMLKNGIDIVLQRTSLDAKKLSSKDMNLFILFFSFDEDISSTRWADTMHFFLNDAMNRTNQQTFIAINTDLLPDIAESEGIPKGLRIARFLNGSYICKDVFEENEKRKSTCMVRRMGTILNNDDSNNQCIPLELKCPRARPHGECEQIDREWSCEKCLKQIEFGFDGKFYCECGIAAAVTFAFKCCDPRHGQDYVKFDTECLLKLIQAIKPFREVNILVLGVTGVGKSTWINAIANYITYPTIEVAKENPLINLIPTEFAITQREGNEDQLISKKVIIKQSKNESYSVEGASVTQRPRAYTFSHNKTLYRIIDTPGIADSRGIEQDKENMEMIMHFVSQYDEIHGICILMMPNENRLTTQFDFCFKELLMQFHRSAVDNIAFCFTNTSGYDFDVSGTITPLRQLLKKIKETQKVIIHLTDHTCYPFDNMAYRYLCATRPEYDFKFTTDQVAMYKKSYEISQKQTTRLLEHFAKQKPHNAKDSLSINYARTVIIRLTVPLASINESVRLTLQKIDERNQLIKECGNDLEELQKILMNKITLIHWKIETNERICCGNQTCYYKTEYRGKDREQFVEALPNALNQDPLVITTYKHYLTEKDGIWQCPDCGPKATKYVNSQWLTKFTEEKSEKNENVASRMNAKKKTQEEIKEQIATEKKLQSEILNEQNQIIRATANFALFLSKHSITTYNDATEGFLKCQIDMAKENKNDTKQKSCEDLLNRYYKEKDILENAIQGAQNQGGELALTAKDVLELVNTLKNMKHYGKDVEAALQATGKRTERGFDGPKQERHFNRSGGRYMYHGDKKKNDKGWLNRAGQAVKDFVIGER